MNRFEYLKSKYHYDQNEVDKTVAFIENHCRHVEGEKYGQPIRLSKFHYEEIIKPIYGLRDENGRRLIKEVYIQTPKKSAKTTITACMGLYGLTVEGGGGKQIYNLAGDDAQANLWFRIASNMVEKDPTMRSMCRVQSHFGFINMEDNFIQRLNSNSKTKEGVNPYMIIYDELHVIPDREMFDNLTSAFGQIPNSLFVAITTPGTEQTTICYNRYDYSKKILKGTIKDDRFWCVISDADKEDNIFSESTWRKANPLYDESLELREVIARDAMKVKNDPSMENSFKRYRLGLWVHAEQDWIPFEKVLKCFGKTKLTRPIVAVNRNSPEQITDISLMQQVDGVVHWEVILLVADEFIKEQDKNYSVGYNQWAELGHIRRIKGNMVSIDEIEDVIYSLPFDVAKVGYYNRLKDLAVRLEYSGYECESKSYNLDRGIKDLKAKIMNGNIIIKNNKCLEWMFSNVQVKESGKDNQMMFVNPGVENPKKINALYSAAMCMEMLGMDVKYETVIV